MDISKPEMSYSRASWPRMYVGEVAIDLVNQEFALSLISDALCASDPLAVESANLQHISLFAADTSLASRTPAATTSGEGSGLRWLTLLDGVPLVRRANALTGRAWPKLSGSDLIEPVLQRAIAHGARVGFLGGTVSTHRQLRNTVTVRFPDLKLAGTWAPERWELSDAAACERIAAEIRANAVDILVVALGKPRQERWIADYAASTAARVFLAFGATVDFLAGTIPRAPRWVGAVGAEWAWRLVLEPKRLGRRYLIDGPPAYLQIRRWARVDEILTMEPEDQGVEQVWG